MGLAGRAGHDVGHRSLPADPAGARVAAVDSCFRLVGGTRHCDRQRERRRRRLARPCRDPPVPGWASLWDLRVLPRPLWISGGRARAGWSHGWTLAPPTTGCLSAVTRRLGGGGGVLGCAGGQ